MSLSAHVHFFTSTSALNKKALVTLTASAVRGNRLNEVSGYDTPNVEWYSCCKQFGRRRREWEHVYKDVSIDRRLLKRLKRGQHTYLTKGTVDEHMPLIESLEWVSLGIAGERWRALDDELRNGFPEAIRGPFIPSSPGCVVGWHDLISSGNAEPEYLYGRAWYSLRFFGHSTPSDPVRFLELFQELPTVKAIRSEVEAVTGPLRPCIVSDV